MASRYYSSGALPTVLAADLGASGNPSVISLPGTWPAEYPYCVLIDWGTSSQEAILVTSAPTGTGPYSLPCTRGIDLTTAQAHNAGAQAEHGTTGYEPTLIQANAAAIAALEAGTGGGSVALAGDLGNTTADPQVLSTHLSAPLPVNQGGTNSNTQNWQGLLTPTTQTGTYTATPGQFVKANIASASWTLKLPNAPAANTIVGAKVIANASGNTHTLTVACQGSDVFEQSGGATSTTLYLLSQAAAWQYNGGYWTRVSDDLPLGQLSTLYGQLATVSSYTADQRFGSGRPWFDVTASEYGADPTGSADSTSAFSAAILAAVGGNLTPSTTVRAALGPVYIPAGTYKISSDLLVQSVLGFQLITAGAEQVILKCTGHAFTNAALYINGADACVFSGFTIIGDGTEGTAASGSGGGIPNAIWLTWNPSTAAQSTSGTTLRNIRTRNLKSVTGVNISATTGAYQVDGSLVEDVLTTGAQTVGSWSGTGLYQYGFLIGNGAFGNQYDHTLVNAGAGLWYYGYYCDVSGYQLYGAQPGGNYCDFYFNYPAAECTINGVQSQVAQMAVQGTASASGSKAVSFRDFYWDGYQSSAPPSDEIITITGDITSAWEFSSCSFLTGASTYTPVISIDSTYGASGVVATFINCALQNSPTSGIAVTGTNTTVVLINYVELSTSTGVPTASFPLYIYSAGSWSAGVGTPSVQWVTAAGSYSWSQPSGAQTVDVLLCAGGAGGGSGAIQTTGNAGGGSGGSGGAMNFRSFVASDLPSSLTGSVGAGGAGGASVSGTSAASGNAGSAGGSTTFSTYLDSYPGSAGQPGTTTGGAAVGGQSTSGGMYQASASGAGGAAANGSPTGTASGGTGGGGGGGATSGTAYNGGASGYSTSGSTSNAGAGGVTGTSSPGTGTQPTVKGTPSCGGGGGGGANGASPTAQAGATAYYGGGGGGGGGAYIASGTGTSGAGGNGGSGFALIITHFA